MKRFKKSAAIALSSALVLVLSVSALAASSVPKEIRAHMGGIQVIVKGVPFEMKDTTGATVEPIVYNGTTYLPVRALAEVVGMEVSWDGDTSTVSLGGKSVTFLDELPATNFESTTTGVSKYESLGETEIYMAKKYSRGLAVTTGIPGESLEKNHNEVTKLYYTLDGSYKSFLSDIDIKDAYYIDQTIIRIYGDGELLYTSPSITKNSLAYPIDLNIEGITKLTIELDSTFDASYAANYGGHYSIFFFGEARLIK